MRVTTSTSKKNVAIQMNQGEWLRIGLNAGWIPITSAREQFPETIGLKEPVFEELEVQESPEAEHEYWENEPDAFEDEEDLASSREDRVLNALKASDDFDPTEPGTLGELAEEALRSEEIDGIPVTSLDLGDFWKKISKEIAKLIKTRETGLF